MTPSMSSIQAPTKCDECGSIWPGYLVHTVNLDGCPACNDPWAPLTARARQRRP